MFKTLPFPDRPLKDRLWFKYMQGHVSLGRLCIYGFNAMHVALDLRTPWGFLCIHPPFIRCFGKTWPWYIYLTKDGTPHDGWGIGPGYHGKRK